MDFEAIITDIPAGGGASIDLQYNKEHKRILELKTFADCSVSKTEIDLEDFEPDKYGIKGWEFMAIIKGKEYSVTVSYELYIRADDGQKAIEKAKEEFGETTPRPDEMTYRITHVGN